MHASPKRPKQGRLKPIGIERPPSRAHMLIGPQQVRRAVRPHAILCADSSPAIGQRLVCASDSAPHGGDAQA